MDDYHVQKPRISTPWGVQAFEAHPMSYEVKEVVCTLRGKGSNSGRPALFCRFAGYNLR